MNSQRGILRSALLVLLAVAATILPAQVPPQVSHPELVITCDPSACPHRYINGADFIILDSPEARLAVAVDRVTLNPHLFSITVAVTNNGNGPIDVVPGNAWIGVDTPKKDKLPSIAAETVASANHGVDYSTVMKLAMQANTIDKGQQVVGSIFFKSNNKDDLAHLIFQIGTHMFYVPLTLQHPR